MEIFEEIHIYNAKCQMSKEYISSICIIIDGVFDINVLSNQIHSIYDLSFTISNIKDGLALLLFEKSTELTNNLIQKELKILNYSIYSIFVKDSYIQSIINEFGDFNANLFYLCYECNSQIIFNRKHPQNVEYFKQSQSSPNKFLYGFNSYSDLIKNYLEIIKGEFNWPILAIFPNQSNFDPKNEIYKSNKLLLNSNSSYPIFCPLKTLYYISFIEKLPKNPQRKLNVDELFQIKNIPDVQISHLYQGNKSNLKIRTFLGFDNKFRCLHAFDFFNNHSKMKENDTNDNDLFIDVLLINNIESSFNIKYDMFYIEVISFVDSSLIYSLNNSNVFNFNNCENCSSKEFSTFYEFDNFNDFDSAKKLIKNFLNKNYIFKDIKLIDQNELSLLFPIQKVTNQTNQNLFFIIFRNKNKDKKNNHIISSLLKNSIIIIKDANCSINNKLYVIAGFNDIQMREKAFNLLNNSKFLCQVKSYLPEIEIKSRTNKFIQLIESQEKEEIDQVQNNEIEDDTKNVDLNQEKINQNEKTKKPSTKFDDTKNSVQNDYKFFEEIQNELKEKNQQIEFKNKNSSDEEKYQSYINSMTVIYTAIINFIEKEEYEEKDYKQMIQLVKDQKIKENIQKLKETLLIIYCISNNHFKNSFFFERIEKLLLIFKDVIGKIFTNIDLFNFFSKNKNILLILIKLKLLTIDQQIADILTSKLYRKQKYHFYFYPEIKKFLDGTMKKKIEGIIDLTCNRNIGIFKQKRQNGVNTDLLCELIRNDSIDEFLKKFDTKIMNFDTLVIKSRFETDKFLFQNYPSLIQYAAFYGAVKIVKYYLNKKIDYDSSLWIYAIRGNRFEIIHLLEEKRIKPKNIFECLKNSIQCHHNEMTNYILSEKIGAINDFSAAIKSYNFAFFSKNIINIASNFVDLCKRNYVIIVEILLNCQNEEINEKIILKLFLFK